MPRTNPENRRTFLQPNHVKRGSVPLFKHVLRLTVLLLSLNAVLERAGADAFVVTKAMQAATIAEIFIEPAEVRVGLEVGVSDLQAFQDLLPDDLYERITGQDKPWEARAQRFLSTQWVVVADDRKLAGRIDRIEIARRVIRDEITGEALPNQPDDAELVIQADLRYRLVEQPGSIEIQPPRDQRTGATTANIGFVTYHLGVAVNDFRYLSAKETLRLDWSDPWYTSFERRNLRRRHFAPAAAFLYIENFEVRKEIVFRPRDLQAWIDLGIEGQSDIPPEQRDTILRKAGSFLDEHTPVQIEGRPSTGTLDRVHFIHRSLRTTGVVETEEPIDIHTAMIGAIYVYPVTSLPQNVTMKWDLFSQRIARVPCVATDEAGGMPGTLQPDDAILKWENFLTHPTRPAFMNVTAPLAVRTVSVPIVSLLCLAGAGILWWRRHHDDRSIRRYGSIAVMFVSAAAMLAVPSLRIDIPIGGPPEVSDREAEDILHSLLHNIYRSFDYREENAVYDVLERSVSGDLLTQIYLQTRQSLTLASQGGARVKVKQVELVDFHRRSTGQGEMVADCSWIVKGDVGHWGHIHQRTNQYRAELAIRATDGRWQITGMDLLSQERL